MRLHVPGRPGLAAAVAAAATIVVAAATIAGRSAPAASPGTMTVSALAVSSVAAHGRQWRRPSPGFHRARISPHAKTSSRAPGARTTPRRSAVETVLLTARAQLGKPYAYGAAGPKAFDCSGLTQYAWAAGGVALPHNAAAQYRVIPHVPLAKLRPGDLVFSGAHGIGHVGIYIGAGRMIHAPHSGTHVEIAALRTDTIGAGRP